MASEALCYTVVTEDSTETPTTQDLRSALQKGSDEVKLDTLRKIIIATINGNPQVCNTCCGCEDSIVKVEVVVASTTHGDHTIHHALQE